MNSFLKSILTIAVFFTFLISQNLNGDWALSANSNFNQISKAGRENIEREAQPILEAFLSKIDINSLSWTRYYDCKDSINEYKYNQYKDQGMDTYSAAAYATETYCNSEKINGIDLSKSFNQPKKDGEKLKVVLDKKSTTWNKFVEYYGGYLEVAEKGLNKDNLKDYNIYQKLNEDIKFTGNNTFTISASWVKSADGYAASDEVKKYYNLPIEKQQLSGKIIMPTITIIDLYKMSKYWKISQKRSTTYTGPEVEFALDDTNKSFKVPLWMIDENNYAKISQKYATVLTEMTTDILKSNPNYRPYRSSKKDKIEFYSMVEKDLMLLMVDFINNPLAENENIEDFTGYRTWDGRIAKKEENIFRFKSEVLLELGRNNTMTLKQKKKKYDAILDSMDGARTYINNARPENIKISKHLLEAQKSTYGDMLKTENIYNTMKWYAKLNIGSTIVNMRSGNPTKNKYNSDDYEFGYLHTTILESIYKFPRVKKTGNKKVGYKYVAVDEIKKHRKPQPKELIKHLIAGVNEGTDVYYKFRDDYRDLKRTPSIENSNEYLGANLYPIVETSCLGEAMSSSEKLIDISYYYYYHSKRGDYDCDTLKRGIKDSPLIEIARGEAVISNAKNTSVSSLLDINYPEEDLYKDLIAFFDRYNKEGKNAKGWEDFRKNKSRKASGISGDRLKKIKENLKKKNYRYIIEANIYRTSKGQEIWMKLGFPYIGKETTIPNSQLRKYLAQFLYENYGEKGS